MKLINPDNIVKPASMYSQGVQIAPSLQRLIISGQVGLRPDGTLEPTMRGQMERTWANLFAVLNAAGFDRQHLAKMTIFVTEPGQTALFREIRDRMMQGHACAATYLQVAGLSSPEFKFEIEAEAVKEAE